MIKRIVGFTLIELIIVIILVGVLAAASGIIINQGFNSFLYSENMTQYDWQAQLALERMVNDFRNIPSTANITTIASNQFVFVDTSGNTVTYALSGTDLTRSGQELISGAASFNLNYYDSSGNSTNTISAIRYIQMSVGVTENSITNTFSTLVYLMHLD